jgi:hypothetical protein
MIILLFLKVKMKAQLIQKIKMTRIEKKIKKIHLIKKEQN